MWKWWQRPRQVVPLVFRWRQAHMMSFRMVFFLVVSVAVHLAAFYAFEVVYPANRKDLVRSASVWLLPPGDPAVRAVLARHEASLRAFSGGGESVCGAPRAEVTMRLSSDDYTPRFEPLPDRLAPAPLVFPDAVPVVLPPPCEPAGAEPREDAGPGWRGGLRWHGPGGIVSEAPLPADWQAPPEDTGGEPWEFRVAYGSGRHIREVAVLRGGGGAEAPLRRQVMSLRVPDSMPLPARDGVAWCRLTLQF